MKVKAKIFYTIHNVAEKEIEIDIPDNDDIDEWIVDNEVAIIEKELPFLDDAFDDVNNGNAWIELL